MKNLYLLIASALLLSCSTTKQTTVAQQQDVYDVINAVMSYQEYIDTDDLLLDKLVVPYKHDVKGLYDEETPEDVILQQEKELLAAAGNAKAFPLDTTRIKGSYRWFAAQKHKEMFKDGYNNSGWEPLFKEYGERSYCLVSVPVFTKDRTIAVVTIRRTNDWQTGSGATFVIKKINGVWTVLGKSSMWIS
ncbi:hypothetical protein AM493_00755 [Flavobacterium akiainvivens]|uniref:DUF3828 domain-containing protein n=1 Tax=Flavobacterium akiainvivens TaxID=1202724 RepID=A0A0M8MFV1_9FLAO|nr:hypothetical protein [Flavobacterium akiainvivens]KOS04738.1 hypothetical protein AM493_00755 [Flavobacterium akiainvivens]SFQ66851.1 hypothetical protein SAMN05444144_11371 [Flavobacterium akiainvivens]